jgi:uncharacterized protein YndB with AHSA1/START domain
MNDTAVQSATQQIVVEEVFPHTAETIWLTLTNGTLIGRWLMEPKGFEAVPGNHFTFQTKAAGAWDGTIRCQVLEVAPNERLCFSWQGGDAGNAGYGSLLDTVVTFTLTPVDGGTRVKIVHSGFRIPTNDSAHKNMSEGWKVVIGRLGSVSGETH